VNTEQIRKVLSDQITGINSGKVDPKRANALCNTVGKFISCVRLELEHARMLGVKPRAKAISALPRKS
jgi:hypothetical protein